MMFTAIELAIMFKKNSLTKNELQTKKLFEKMQLTYNSIFNDVELVFIIPNMFIGTCIGVEPDENGLSYLFIESEEIEDMPILLPNGYFREITKLKGINPKLSMLDFVLLHELGHYLDYIDNPEEMEEDGELSVEIMNYIYENYNFDNETTYYLYQQINIEKRADINAYAMAEVLNRE